MNKRNAIAGNKLIYLASPYTSRKDTKKERAAQHNERYNQALHAAAMLSQEGLILFSPIVHSHPMHVMHGLKGDWAFWSRIDLTFIDRCDAVWVLDLPGWFTSVGVRAEMRHATDTNKPISFISYPSLELTPPCTR